MRYGLPYKGSKNGIAEWVIEHLPGAAHFYDLFAGGCAVTHAAMLSGKYETYTASDITDSAKLFGDAIAGKYRNETRWISREDFFRLKDTDPYVRICWSFGNGQKSYLYAKEIEPWKKALHYARVFHDTSLLHEMGIVSDGSRSDIALHKAEYKEKYIRWWLSRQGYTAQELDELIEKTKEQVEIIEEGLRQYLLAALKASGLTQAEVGRRLGTQMQGHYFGRSQWEFPTQEEYEKMQRFLPLPQDYNEIIGVYRLKQSLQSLGSLESLERLQSLERLKSLQSLQSLQSLEILQGDYQAVDIKPHSVIYCDIPYQGTTGYLGAFDYERFFDWCGRQQELVMISEYNMPKDRFLCVAAKEKRVAYSATNNNGRKIERLFIPAHQKELYESMRPKESLFDFPQYEMG